MWGRCFAFKVNTYQIRQYISLPSIVVTNRHSIVIAAERSVITLVVNMSTCKYNWKGLNESAFPAHLYLSQYYIFRDHLVNSQSTFRKNQCLSIDFIALIPQKLTISTHQHQSPLLLIKFRAKCGILCPKTLLLIDIQLHAKHFFVDLQFFAPWRSHNPLRITNSPITGKSFF